MASSVLNGYIMVQKRIFWTIEEHSYFVYHHINSYQKIKVYRVEKWIWVRYTWLIGVSVILKCNHLSKYCGIYCMGIGNFAGVIQCWTMTRFWHISDTYNHMLNCIQFVLRLRFCSEKGGYKTVICVVYVDNCLFRERLQSDIDNVIESSMLQLVTLKWRVSVWVLIHWYQDFRYRD